jgi:hypothetical protein
MSKGYEGWILVREGNGWGSTTVREGHALFADSVDLSVNKEFTERPEKITFGRSLKASQRTSGAQKPGGNVEFQPRSDDFPLILMAHNQMYEGTVSASVATYTFVPVKTQPDWQGATYGSGSYTTSAGDMFVVDVWQKFHAAASGTTNIQKYTSCFVDEITLTAAANEDLKVSASFKADSYGSANSASSEDPNSSQGSYSTNSQFEFFSGTMTFAGDSETDIDITNFSISSKNNAEDRITIGNLNPARYPFGRIMVDGELTMDMPNDGLKHMGSMLDNRAFTVVGTFYNAADDQISFSMPNCRRDPFSVNQSGGEAINEMSIPFSAYESDDGVTSPITWTVTTAGLGSAFSIV